MRKKHSLSFLGLALLVLGCSQLDAPERSLPKGALQGNVVESQLTDDELEANGARVVYRFKSVPNLIFVRYLDPQEKATSIVRTDVVAEAKRRPKLSRFLLDTQTPAPVLAPIYRGPPEQEAGFDTARALLDEKGVRLEPVRVALIDSGVVPSSVAIASVLEHSTNLTNDADPCLWQDHGTAIASVYAGVLSPFVSEAKGCPQGSGVARVPGSGSLLARYADNIRLHSIKISFDVDRPEALSSEYGPLQLAVALDEAVSQGVKLVNLSFSYQQEAMPPDVSAAELYIMRKAAEKGVVFVAAAGNSGRSLDSSEVFPARYDLSNIVVVGSHTSYLRKAETSNYGKSVDITAQGSGVYANTREGNVHLFSGTSFAVPMVVSALAMYLGVAPHTAPDALLSDLFATADSGYAPDYDSSSLVPSVSRHGRLNVTKLIKSALLRKESSGN